MISDDTPIIPFAVACNVIEEAQRFIGVPLDLTDELADKLSDRAEAVYAANEGFAKTIRAGGNRGRDQLYVWMRHWLAALLPRSQRKALPPGFANGEEPDHG